MSCPKTPHILQEYLADDLTPLAKEEIDKHLLQCEHCASELEVLMLTQSQLANWQAERVPHWDRGMELFRREHRVGKQSSSWFSAWQWMPTAASFAMLCLLIFNTSVEVGDGGFSVSFGSPVSDMDAALAAFEQEQRTEIDSMIARFESRQDTNNLQLMQAVMSQTQQATVENLDQIYAYFEEQRRQDMQLMSQGYQQLADSDYATVQSLQELAQFVSFQGAR
ncbi:MAG: zf-HC2 domain-containing protein [Proteobacteria bacterium]|jgi:hypothetical protein|nr:zf-HC2 domain-containing protein [Pseudomonadota bacterium]MDA0929068.1 zf-HC2 domain-containing protein [Pseudomonadota bacterium]